MSMCMYAGVHSSWLDYPLQMNQAAQTWAGYASSTDVHNIYTQHY